MNALTLSALLFLYFGLSQSITAFIVTETTSEFELGDCQTVIINNNQTTECSNPGGPSYIESIADITVSGIDGAPGWFNDLWVGVHVSVLILALLSAITYFVGLLFGGSG